MRMFASLVLLALASTVTGAAAAPGESVILYEREAGGVRPLELPPGFNERRFTAVDGSYPWFNASLFGTTGTDANTFTVGAGTYAVRARAVMDANPNHRLHLQDVTDAANPVNVHSGSYTNPGRDAFLVSLIVVPDTETRTFKLVHETDSTATFGTIQYYDPMLTPQYEVFATTEVQQV